MTKTHDLLSIAITELLRRAQAELDQCGTSAPTGTPSWIASMTAAKVLSGIASVLIDVRETEDKGVSNVQT